MPREAAQEQLIARAIERFESRTTQVIGRHVFAKIKLCPRAHVTKTQLKWMLELCKKNMEELYLPVWGWSDRKKRMELAHADAHFLIATQMPHVDTEADAARDVAAPPKKKCCTNGFHGHSYHGGACPGDVSPRARPAQAASRPGSQRTDETDTRSKSEQRQQSAPEKVSPDLDSGCEKEKAGPCSHQALRESRSINGRRRGQRDVATVAPDSQQDSVVDALAASSRRCDELGDGGTAKWMGYCHFRFEREDGMRVVYVYELQVEEAYQRCGIGLELMRAVHSIASASGAQCTMLTVMKSNTSAVQFYRSRLGYAIHSSSPSRCGDSTCGYEILYRACTTPVISSQ